MLVCSIRPTCVEELRELPADVDLIEIRLDGLQEIPFHELQDIARRGIPFILAAPHIMDEEVYVQLAACAPLYLDVPCTMPSALFTRLKRQYPDVKIIASYHNYECTPEDLSGIYIDMFLCDCDRVKIVTYATSTLDALRMLCFLHFLAPHIPVTAFCMGEMGRCTRILQPLFGGKEAMSYACLEGKPTAEGQLSYKEMQEVYHFHKLSAQTKLFALLGDPVDKSPSHILHNALFRFFGLDFVYVKLTVTPDECKTVMAHLFFLARGLSITAPLKQQLRNANTVFFKGRTKFLNTDGLAVMDALQAHGPLKGARCLIIGAGVTGKAIGAAAKKRGCQVQFFNRTAKEGVQPLEDLQAACLAGYDILVQATPITELPITAECIHPGTRVVDVVLAHETPLLSWAKARGAVAISGFEMWCRQAAQQIAIWTEGRVGAQEALAFFMEHAVVKGAEVQERAGA